MGKKVLVIGSSYFVGRVFCLQAARTGDFGLTVINRGNAPLGKPDIREHAFDRNDDAAIRANLLPLLAGERFDALIDTCAYEPGQIQKILGLFGDRIGHYIYISTASVYAVGDLSERREGDPVMAEPKQRTEMTDYVYKKLLLERELTAACEPRGIPWTILRPTIIFGPFSYAPRERWFIERIAKGQPVPVLTDAPAAFNMVYVHDISRALQILVGDERGHNQIFNLAAPERITWPLFYDSLERCNGAPYERRPCTQAQAAAESLPLTMPTTHDELYSGEKFAKTFALQYTPYDDAMKKTFEVFKGVYAG